MRIKSINGSIKTVTEVVAAVEYRHSFNGVKRRLFEKCRDISVKANALVFMFENNAQPMGMCQTFGAGNESMLVLGNLSAEQAEEITNALLAEGYFDLTGLTFQKSRLSLDNYKVDDGQSGAYAFATNSCLCIFTNTNGFGDGIFAPCEISADDEDDSDEGFEEDDFDE